MSHHNVWRNSSLGAKHETQASNPATKQASCKSGIILDKTYLNMAQLVGFLYSYNLIFDNLIIILLQIYLDYAILKFTKIKFFINFLAYIRKYIQLLINENLTFNAY